MIKLLVIQLGILFVYSFSFNASSNSDVLTSISRKDSYIETSIQMAAYLEQAVGNTDKSKCIINNYFGAPDLTRATIHSIYRYPNKPVDGVLAIFLDKWCKEGENKIRYNETLWKYTNTEKIIMPSFNDGTIKYTASIRTINRRAIREDDIEASKCLIEKYDNELIQYVSNKIKQPKTMAVYEAAYDASRKLCNYPKHGQPTSEISLPFIPDMLGAAKERIITYNYLLDCKNENNNKEYECRQNRYDERRESIYRRTVNALDAKVKISDDRLDQMRRKAWRLPDGRVIFESKKGGWFFENGDRVPSELVNQRIKPKL